MLNLGEEVRRRAEKCFNDGYDCAQAVALSNIEMFIGRQVVLRWLWARDEFRMCL